MAKAFQAKFKSKYEVYRFLTLDARAYLPYHETVTIYFMKELMGGKKKILTTAKIRIIHVPQ